MKRHDTPIDVAKVLARHAPKNISTILEPSVGRGVLLDALLGRLKKVKNVTCVDIDELALKQVISKFRPRFKDSLELVQDNYLQWASSQEGKEHRNFFDCVAMNPPFSAQSKVSIELPVDGDKQIHRVPLEIGFILRATQMLRPSGRLLAVVPASVVASQTTAWFRDFLMEIGAIQYIHELPRHTFSGVEARIYLFVFEKGVTQSSLKLYNHDLEHPHILQISKKSLGEGLRLDYRYHDANAWYRELQSNWENLGWLRISQTASVIRGSLKSPKGAQNGIHSTNFQDGVWTLRKQSEKLSKRNSKNTIRKKDILVVRVGRNCALSFGHAGNVRGYECSDCVLILRPSQENDSFRILFALRTLLAWSKGANLIERGTGAAYITMRDIANVSIPYNLADFYPEIFSKYSEATQACQYPFMQEIESAMREILLSEHARCSP